MLFIWFFFKLLFCQQLCFQQQLIALFSNKKPYVVEPDILEDKLKRPENFVAGLQ